MDIAKIRVNTDAIENGAWVDGIPGAGNLRLKVRGYSSKVYSEDMARRLKTVGRDDRERDGKVKPDVLRQITQSAIADTILLDWENLSMGGDVVPFSREAAAQFIADPELMEFLAMVDYAATIVGKQ